MAAEEAAVAEGKGAVEVVVRVAEAVVVVA